MMRRLFILVLLLFFVSNLSTAQDLSGDWKGYVAIHGHKLQNNLHFEKQNGEYSGTIDIPQQGAKGLRLHQITVSSQDSVSWKLDGGPGGMIHFKGRFKSDSTINGTFHQSGYQFPFKLHRYAPSSEAKKTLAYHHKDIIIKNDSIQIGGTLTWPENKQANQLVIMISGSSAQNRDEEILGFKIFGQIADYLTTHGIATFRYDDRGIGKSTGNFTHAGLDDLSSDVESIINYFSNSSSHYFKTLVLLGHSQGGYIGSRIAAQDSLVDKLILMSSPAVSLSKVVLAQISPQYVKLEKAIFDTLRGSQNFTQLADSMLKIDLEDFSQQPDSIQKQIKNPEKYFRNKGERELKYMASPSYFSFLDYDPTQDLSRIHIPVLALFAGKDTQVQIDQNRPPMQAALVSAGVSYQINVFKNANHLYQKANTGSFKEYSTLKKQFVKGFLPTIEAWLKRTP